MRAPAISTPKQLLDWLDGEAETFSNAMSMEFYLNHSGQKDELALTPIFRRHRKIFQRDTVERVLKARTRDGRLPNLREFVVDGYLEQAAKGLSEEIAARETNDTVRWQRKRVPYRAVQQLVMNEEDTARRHELDRLRLEVTASQNPLRQQRWDLVYAKTRELGFEHYVALCDELGDLRLQRLRETMERFLWETEKPYRERLERELRGIGVDPALADRSDLLRLFRLPQFDASFTSERMLPVLEATVRGLGLDAERQAFIHIDAGERPRKSPRAFVAPARVPDEVYLVISPHGGQDDYRALFHEAGHAQHFAHIRGDQPYAYRGMGDNSVTEGFAFVMEQLMYNAPWLRKHLGMRNAKAYISFTRFNRLYYLRRYAAKLLYELELHSAADPRSFRKRYADLLTVHVGVRYDPEDYLADLDDGFYCARYLRAWIFDAQLRAQLTSRWGEAWFASPEAGALLRELWGFGQRYTAEELLRRLGAKDLDIAPLAAELTA